MHIKSCYTNVDRSGEQSGKAIENFFLNILLNFIINKMKI